MAMSAARKKIALKILEHFLHELTKENDMETNVKLHPKLQIAVDRLNKRYANISVKKYHTRECYTGKRDEQGNRLMETYIVVLQLYTDVSPNKFAELRVEETFDDPSEHKFVVESRLIQNYRSPRDEKHTTKEKSITKLVDEFVRPFTLQERGKELLKQGQRHVSNMEWSARTKKDSAKDLIRKKYMSKLIEAAMEDVKFERTPDFVEAINALEEVKKAYNWIRANTHSDKGSAVQVVAFQLGDRWVLNLFGGKEGGNCMVEYDSFDVMPEFIQQKIALLRIAPHNELLDDVGVKVQENSYFLYGQELQELRTSNDTGEESQGQGN